MTDPWCCYIWRAMDPIKKYPSHVSIFLPAPAGSVMGSATTAMTCQTTHSKQRFCLFSKRIVGRCRSWTLLPREKPRQKPQLDGHGALCEAPVDPSHKPLTWGSFRSLRQEWNTHLVSVRKKHIYIYILYIYYIYTIYILYIYSIYSIWIYIYIYIIYIYIYTYILYIYIYTLNLVICIYIYITSMACCIGVSHGWNLNIPSWILDRWIAAPCGPWWGELFSKKADKANLKSVDGMPGMPKMSLAKDWWYTYPSNQPSYLTAPNYNYSYIYDILLKL